MAVKKVQITKNTYRYKTTSGSSRRKSSSTSTRRPKRTR